MGSLVIPGAFDPHAGWWEPYPTAPVRPFEQTRLKLVTYNIWFGGFARSERTSALLELLANCDADIIGLQEVTPPLLDQILQTTWIRAAYTISDISGGSVDPYGVLMLSRIPLINWRLDVLPSAMGRMLLSGELHAHGTRTYIATVHLESTIDAAPIRAKQLRRIFPLLEGTHHALLMGDFNFCSTWPAENRQLDPEYLDLWHELHPAQPGYTIDSSRNTMRFEQDHEQKQVRFDRIIMRSQRPGWIATQMDVIGTEPIASGPPAIFVSDHFGLSCTLEWR